MKKKEFSRKTETEIAQLYSQGYTAMELGQRFHCHQTTIARVLKTLGLNRGRGYGRTPAFIRRYGPEIHRRYAIGMSYHEIARRLEISADSVKKVLTLQGIRIQRRPRTGSDHPMWNGGRFVGDKGYVEARCFDSRFSSMADKNGYVPEHRLVMAEYLGRPLNRHESVHHIDGNRRNNALANLELRQGKHGAGIRFVCLACGSHNIAAVPLAAKES